MPCAALLCGLALACGPEPTPEGGAAPGDEDAVERDFPPEQDPPEDEPGDEDEGDTWASHGDAPGAERLFRARCPAPGKGRRRTLYVEQTRSRDSEAPRGSRDNPYSTISAAVRAARPGDTIRVLGGTYEERVVISGSRARAGTEDAPIVLRGDSRERPRLVLDSGDRGSLLVVNRPYWVIQNVELDAGNQSDFAALFQSDTHCSRLIDSELHRGTAGGGVILDRARNVLIGGNEIHDFSMRGGDSHGVVVKNDSRDIFVLENDIHRNSGDSVQCHTNGGRPAVVFIERNQLHDSGENGVDIKGCDHVYIRGNAIYDFPNLNLFPWQRTSSAAEAVVIHEDADTVQVVNNRIARAGRGVSVGGTSRRATPSDVLLQGNHISDIRDLPAMNGQGIRVVKANGVRVLENTLEKAEDVGLHLAADRGLQVSGLVVEGNLVRDMERFVKLGPAADRPGLRMDENRYGEGGRFEAVGLVSTSSFSRWQRELRRLDLEQDSELLP